MANLIGFIDETGVLQKDPAQRFFGLGLDHLSKPKASPKFYELEVAKARSRGRNPVYNACMLESHASLFIQLVDVLVGCVVFDYRMKHRTDWSPNPLKRELVEMLRAKLGVESLAGKLLRTEPNRFTVWPFKMG